MAQNTNLNTSPYFDDFDVTKNYQRVLFKPGTPIQARELTTLQSILQNQVEKFGKHFFKEGQVVIPGNTAYDSEYTCVQIDPTHLGIPVSTYIQYLIGKRIKGETSGVFAKVERYITSDESERDNYTLYIKYQSASETDFTGKTFVDGENLIVLDNVDYGLGVIRTESSFATTIIEGSTATGSAIKIEEGVYFIRGFFVDVFPQAVILDQYTNLPNYRVGLSIFEDIAVPSQSNQDLFDNARGFSNFAAPGADRLRITATLIKKSLTDFNDENFVELVRIENGIIKKVPKKEQVSTLITDELARRTNEESGDYYVKPFRVIAKESLNDRIGNNGVYNPGQLTREGNTPSNDLLALQISPGKAYVKGYEVETLITINADLEKPRTTETVKDTTVPFSLGNQVELNNVYGTLPVGFGVSSQVTLYSERTVTPGLPAGIPIGIGRVYDLKLKNAEYQDASTIFESSCFDLQTYTYIQLNTTISLTAPAFVEGKNSSASGYLVSDVTNSNQLVLYQAVGNFTVGEQLQIDGENVSRTITAVRDYSLGDVRQFVGYVGATTAFTADTIINQGILLGPQNSEYTISANSGGISTVTSSVSTFGVGINTGDIFVYTKAGQVLPTYNRVTEVNASGKSIKIEATTNVSGVSIGSLPTSEVETSDLLKGISALVNTREAYYFAELENSNIASVDVSEGEIIFRKSYSVTVASNGLTSTLESDTDITLEPFDEEDYSLVFSDGTIETLTAGQFSISSGRTLTLTNLSQNGAATLTATLKKKRLKSRKKTYNRCAVLTIANSSKTSSGIGSTTISDGLTYSPYYGTRVQDERISLNVPDVAYVAGIFESSDGNDADLPKLELVDLNANILNAIKGEIIYGETSNAMAMFVATNGTNQLEFVYTNENTFQTGERIRLYESNVSAEISLLIEGDRNIINDFIFDSGQTVEIADFSSIRRKTGVTPPSRRLKIVYNHYYIDANDDGDFVTVNSYDNDRYSTDLPQIGIYRGSDIIDLRPRVSPYDSSVTPYSPFEFNARQFVSATNSSPYNFAKDKNLFLSYNYYLARTDKLYLNRYGEFFISKGVPSLSPVEPSGVENSLEVATITMRPYVYNVDDVTVQLSPHKRYRMQDIARLEDRLRNVEYYTSLSLLETDTKNLKVRDSQTQLDRFKCGFLVDNFKSVQTGALGDPQHKCSIDTTDGLLRPQHYTTSIDLLLGSEAVIGASNSSNPDADLRFVKDLGSPNTVKVGDVVCLKYSHVEFLKNTFATRIENVNPFAVVNWIGQIELNPATDTWVETKGTKRTVDQEGNYSTTIQQLGVDSNTGMSPIDWGAWETTWTGSRVIARQNMGRIHVGSQVIGRSESRGGFQQGRGIPITTRTTFRDQYTTFQNVTTLTTTKQARQGIQYKVAERYDSANLGTFVVSTEVIHVMRSRNIEFISRRLKPKTQLYPFFDDVDMIKYVVPKLIEIEMKSGAFQVGETVTGTVGTTSIRFRLASPNHKYGAYNNATQIYTSNPYKPNQTIPASYSTTSSILNADTASLELQSNSGYYGHIVKNMQLKGETSKAIARVTNLRLITDSSGTLIGSLFIPDSKLQSTPSFETGTKTFVLTTSSTNATIVGSTDSTADAKFTSSGTLNNTEEVTLRTRNADVERLNRSEERTLTSQGTSLQAGTAFANRTVTQSRWVDPLAQSFEVPDENGVFITKCDVFFQAKDTNDLPVTMQIRTMQTGLPTTTIIPFGEVILDPSQVNISDDGKVSTTFTFPSPVYLETGNSYCVVLLSASNEYKVWVSRMGEEDVTTLDLPESQKVVVSQQPLLGSLFKSQNGATWDPSQLEDLKLTLYRAKFVTEPSTVRFYNPKLDIGNNQIVTLRANPLDTISKSTLVGLAKSLTSAEVSGLTPGSPIFQSNNAVFRSNLRSVVGAIGIGSTLSVTSPGIGFTSTFKTYSNVDVISITGNGFGAKVNLSVDNGVAIAATVSIGGTGYAYGDALEVNYTQTDGLGTNLILAIPNNVGIISSFNSLLVDRVQGNLVQNATDSLFYVGTSGTSLLTGATVNTITDLSDGLHFKVSHNNHGMYSLVDKVRLTGIEPDQRPQTLKASYNSTSTGSIVVSNVGIFTSFENATVSSVNPGYILIDNEVIKYTGIVTSTNSLTGITRNIDNTVSGSYALESPVFKYELNGVSLRRINKTHSFSDTDLVTYPTDLDYYYIKVDMSDTGGLGIDRTPGNGAGYPALYFNSDKSCGSYDTVPLSNSPKGPKATQNIPFSLIRPNIATMLPQQTSISAKVRTFSGSSVDSNLTSFVDQGFVDISLNGNTEFSSPRIIASQLNEETYLADFPGKKSFTMEFTMSTDDEKVSPMIDLDRVNLITISNRINSKVTNYATDSRVNSLTSDPTAATYLSNIVVLDKVADSLKVFLDAFKHPSSDIRLCYRIFRSDTPQQAQLWQLFPGYDNLDANSQVINQSNNNGRPDKRVANSIAEDNFNSYEFTASNLPQFNGFQIKILMSGTNSAFVPKIRDFRVIATI
jgi:hypothetical protein